jgi:hypothetical protein
VFVAAERHQSQPYGYNFTMTLPRQHVIANIVEFL